MSPPASSRTGPVPRAIASEENGGIIRKIAMPPTHRLIARNSGARPSPKRPRSFWRSKSICTASEAVPASSLLSSSE